MSYQRETSNCAQKWVKNDKPFDKYQTFENILTNTQFLDIDITDKYLNFGMKTNPKRYYSPVSYILLNIVSPKTRHSKMAEQSI